MSVSAGQLTKVASTSTEKPGDRPRKSTSTPTGRPRGRPRKKAREPPIRPPVQPPLVPPRPAPSIAQNFRFVFDSRSQPLEATSSLSVPEANISTTPNYSRTLFKDPILVGSAGMRRSSRGKGKMPVHSAEGDMFDRSANAQVAEPSLRQVRPHSRSDDPLANDVQDPQLEWYLDMETVTWRRRRSTRLENAAHQSLERATTRPNSISSLPSKTQTPPGSASPSEPRLPGPPSSNLSFQSIPFAQVKPLKKRQPRASRGNLKSKQPEAVSIDLGPPSSSRRPSPVVPDPEEEPRKGIEGFGGVLGSRTGGLTPSAHAVPAIRTSVRKPPRGSLSASNSRLHGEHVSNGQIRSAARLDERASLPSHVVDTSDVLEYQNQDVLFAALREAIVSSSQASSAERSLSLEFSGCYSLLIDPMTVLNEDIVDGVATILAEQIGITFR